MIGIKFEFCHFDNLVNISDIIDDSSIQNIRIIHDRGNGLSDRDVLVSFNTESEAMFFKLRWA